MKDSKVINTKRALMIGIIIFSTAASLLVFVLIDTNQNNTKVSVTSIVSVSATMLSMLLFSWDKYRKVKALKNLD